MVIIDNNIVLITGVSKYGESGSPSTTCIVKHTPSNDENSSFSRRQIAK